MRMVALKQIAILSFFVVGYALVFPHFAQVRMQAKIQETKGLTLPPLVAKILSLEFQPLVADFLLVRATQFFGSKIQRTEQASREDYLWMYRNLILITDLDPYFEDPYYFGNALLAWTAGGVKEANMLLKRGTEARTWDWMPPFFLGFNKFYFLNENSEGADYLLVASRRPDAPSFLPTLAARLYQRERRTETAITFLQGFIEAEKNESLKKSFSIRLDALKKILFLEKAVIGYKKRTGKFPKRLEELVQKGMIGAMPIDPYGGVFYIDKDGSIMTTSKLAYKPDAPRQDHR